MENKNANNQPQIPNVGNAPYTPNYNAAPYTPNNNAAPYTPQSAQGQPPYGQPYGQPYGAYPQPPQKKKMSAGKIIVIIISIFFIFLLLMGIAVFKLIFPKTENELIEQYKTTGSFSDLVNLCDYYDSMLTINPEKIAHPDLAATYFDLMLSDTKQFIRNYDNDAASDSYADGKTAYSEYLASYFYILLRNGSYDLFTHVFTEKLLEYNAAGDYYTDSYTLIYNIENSIIELTDEQKDAVTKGYDALLAASRSQDEMQYNLMEYYECCEAMQMYEKADELERMLQESEAENKLTNANLVA